MEDQHALMDDLESPLAANGESVEAGAEVPLGETEVPMGENGAPSTVDVENRVDSASLDAIEAELADVERALQRLDEGTYGTCETCGETLSEHRLVEAPAARYCERHLPLSLP